MEISEELLYKVLKNEIIKDIPAIYVIKVMSVILGELYDDIKTK